MRRANGQKRLDWLFLISPITVKRRWGEGRRHAGTRDGLEGGAWPGRAEEWDYQPEEDADLLIHWTTLIIISNEKYSLPLLRAVSLSAMK